MLQNNFPRDEYTFEYAVMKGKQSFSSSQAPCNLDNIKWLLQNNFPYNTSDYNKYTQMINE